MYKSFYFSWLACLVLSILGLSGIFMDYYDIPLEKLYYTNSLGALIFFLYSAAIYILPFIALIILLSTYFNMKKNNQVINPTIVKYKKSIKEIIDYATDGSIVEISATGIEENLLTPISKKPCFYYELSINIRNSKNYKESYSCANFKIKDHSGEIVVNPYNSNLSYFPLISKGYIINNTHKEYYPSICELYGLDPEEVNVVFTVSERYRTTLNKKIFITGFFHKNDENIYIADDKLVTYYNFGNILNGSINEHPISFVKSNNDHKGLFITTLTEKAFKQRNKANSIFIKALIPVKLIFIILLLFIILYRLEYYNFMKLFLD